MLRNFEKWQKFDKKLRKSCSTFVQPIFRLIPGTRNPILGNCSATNNDTESEKSVIEVPLFASKAKINILKKQIVTE